MKAAASQPETRTISAAEFKAKCLQLMDEVNEKKLTLIVTKRGKPVMEATAPTAAPESFRSLWGRAPDVKILGDMDTKLPWPDPAIKWKRANRQKRVP